MCTLAFHLLMSLCALTDTHLFESTLKCEICFTDVCVASRNNYCTTSVIMIENKQISFYQPSQKSACMLADQLMAGAQGNLQLMGIRIYISLGVYQLL